MGGDSLLPKSPDKPLDLQVSTAAKEVDMFPGLPQFLTELPLGANEELDFHQHQIQGCRLHHHFVQAQEQTGNNLSILDKPAYEETKNTYHSAVTIITIIQSQLTAYNNVENKIMHLLQQYSITVEIRSNTSKHLKKFFRKVNERPID